MKRLLAALLCVAFVGVLVVGSQASVGHSSLFKWRTQNNGTVDSSSCKADGSANANRDTSEAIYALNIAPQRGNAVGLADSTGWLRVTISPRPGSSLTAAADSLYMHIQGTPDGVNWYGMTNLTDFLVLENGSTNSFSAFISWGRRPQEVPLWESIRIIIRGDYNGEYEGRVSFFTEASHLTR